MYHVNDERARSSDGSTKNVNDSNYLCHII